MAAAFGYPKHERRPSNVIFDIFILALDAFLLISKSIADSRHATCVEFACFFGLLGKAILLFPRIKPIIYFK